MFSPCISIFFFDSSLLLLAVDVSPACCEKSGKKDGAAGKKEQVLRLCDGVDKLSYMVLLLQYSECNHFCVVLVKL